MVHTGVVHFMETTLIRRSPKSEKKAIAQQQAVNAAYEKFINREDVRKASFNFKRLLIANVVILAIAATIATILIVFNINRGDNIFTSSFRQGSPGYSHYVIPWLEWHQWLESVAYTVGIVAGACIALLVADIIVPVYYKSKVSDQKLDQFMSASAKATRDIEIRGAFKQRFGNVYNEIMEGRYRPQVQPLVAQATSTQEPGSELSVSLPPPPKVSALPPAGMKMPPKISIAAPGSSIKIVPPAVAPPVPGGETKKKVPSGPVEGEKFIFVFCEKCAKTLRVPVPKKLVLDNELEVVPVSIIHGEGAQKHVLTVYLDGDFKSRRDYVSDMLTI
nr:hypothetical protein [Candidatus Sigynarchaeota archaeon]